MSLLTVREGELKSDLCPGSLKSSLYCSVSFLILVVSYCSAFFLLLSCHILFVLSSLSGTRHTFVSSLLALLCHF